MLLIFKRSQNFTKNTYLLRIIIKKYSKHTYTVDSSNVKNKSIFIENIQAKICLEFLYIQIANKVRKNHVLRHDLLKIGDWEVWGIN